LSAEIERFFERKEYCVVLLGALRLRGE